MRKVLRYWLSILIRGLKEAAKFMALHKFWVALSPATLAPIYLWCVFGIHSVTNLWKIAISAAMGYATAFLFALLWKLFSLPAELHNEKLVEAAKESDRHRMETEKLSADSELRIRQQAETHASEIEKLTAEIASLRERKTRGRTPVQEVLLLA